MTVSTRRRPHQVRSTAHHHARRALPWVLIFLLAGCDHRVASHKAIDVCALALDPVSTLLHEVPTPTSYMRAPSAGHCDLTTPDGRTGAKRISITVMTSASMAPDDLSRSATLMLAEAEQTYGDPGTSELAPLAKLAVTFSSAPGRAQQIVIGERGVLMEIGLDSTGFSQQQVTTLATELWTRVLAHQPATP